MDARVGVVVEGGRRNHLPLQQKKEGWKQSQIGTLQQLLAGGIAGAFSKTCTAPLARLTILLQVQGMHADVTTLKKAGLRLEASRIFREEGFRAFWKGNLVTIAHRLPYSSVNFYAYEQYKSFLQSIIGDDYKRNAGAGLCVHFVGGGLGGITAASATYPLDLVRTRLAAQRNSNYYRGIWHAFHTICREEGFLGLYKGLGATLLGVGPNIAISFSVYESLRSFWQSQRSNDSPVMVSLACGSLSGIASSTATFPLYLVRRRMQLEGAGGRACIYNSGLRGTFRHIMRTEGLHGFYRGILPEYCKVVPSVGIVFMTYEFLKLLMTQISTAVDDSYIYSFSQAKGTRDEIFTEDIRLSDELPDEHYDLIMEGRLLGTLKHGWMLVENLQFHVILPGKAVGNMPLRGSRVLANDFLPLAKSLKEHHSHLPLLLMIPNACSVVILNLENFLFRFPTTASLSDAEAGQ